jgi:hypothetical protein
MSWENELKEEIKFTSPNFNIFTALWRNNERSTEKKLGLFDPPKFKGTIVQDLESKSIRYPLNVYFEGIFHNSEAEDFFNALDSESGQWEVIHPVKGPLILQLMSAREVMSPVENGNYTEFQTEWILPANITRLISPDELAASILSSALNAIDDALLVLAQLRADLYSAVQSAINTMNKIAGFMDKVLGELVATDALIEDSYLSARAALESALSAYSIDSSDTADMGEAFVNAGTVPVNISDDFSQRFTNYNDFNTEIFTLTPDTVTQDDYSIVVSQEFNVTIVLIAIAQIVATSEFTTRAEVISAIENLTTIFNDSVAALDEMQDAFSGLDIEFQYFSESQSYTSLINLYTLAIQYLISQFYNLKIEKRFILKTPRSPLEIAVTEYGDLGESDFYYDLFLSSNKLNGNDILALPAGREVLIYA